QPDQRFALFRPLGKKLLGGGENRVLIRFHLDLRHRFHGDGHPLVGIKVLQGSDVKRHQLQRQVFAGLHHRKNDGASSRVNMRTAHSVYDQHFVGSGLAIHSGDHNHHHQQHKNQEPRTHNHYLWQPKHRNLPFLSARTVGVEPQSETVYFVNSSHLLTKAMPFSYRSTTTSVPFSSGLPSSQRAPAQRRAPPREKMISPVPFSRMGMLIVPTEPSIRYSPLLSGGPERI